MRADSDGAAADLLVSFIFSNPDLLVSLIFSYRLSCGFPIVQYQF